MRLIADSGSSKIAWACLSDERKAPVIYETAGCNPVYGTEEEARLNILKSLPKGIRAADVTEIYFYGAGVLDSKVEGVRKILSGAFPSAEAVFVSNDLLGAARALLGKDSGFAAILGTGMNSCIYERENIVFRIPSLGFILGDEGSAGYIGKTLLRDYLRRNMPSEVREEVAGIVAMSDDEIISRIYSQPFPNRFCAGFCKYVSDNKLKHDYCRSLIEHAFDDFFRNIVSGYPGYGKYSFNCVGSTAFANKDILCETAERYGMEVGRIIRNPIDGLIDYHFPLSL
jgi:hypothetical protein